MFVTVKPKVPPFPPSPIPAVPVNAYVRCVGSEGFGSQLKSPPRPNRSAADPPTPTKGPPNSAGVRAFEISPCAPPRAPAPVTTLPPCDTTNAAWPLGLTTKILDATTPNPGPVSPATPGPNPAEAPTPKPNVRPVA